jgi:hypothetical protein
VSPKTQFKNNGRGKRIENMCGGIRGAMKEFFFSQICAHSVYFAETFFFYIKYKVLLTFGTVIF